MKHGTTTIADAMTHSTLAHINSHIRTIEELNSNFLDKFKLIGMPCKITHVSNGQLYIQVGNGVLMTKLRFQESAILQWANNEDSGITKVKFSVNPALCSIQHAK